MARITVEDCLENVDNRFQLVMVSSKRARQLQTGGRDPLVPVDNDKPTVIALREIAEGLVNAEILIEKPSVDLEAAEIQMEEAVAAVEESAAKVEDTVATEEDTADNVEEPVAAAEQEDPPSTEV